MPILHTYSKKEQGKIDPIGVYNLKSESDLKGKLNGFCNRAHCSMRAIYLHRQNLKYYCYKCATEINTANSDCDPLLFDIIFYVTNTANSRELISLFRKKHGLCSLIYTKSKDNRLFIYSFEDKSEYIYNVILSQWEKYPINT